MTFVSDIAAQLLSCYDLALQDGPNPPPDDNICFRVGLVPFDIGLSQDLCCEGFAWVRVIRVYPSTQFPIQELIADNCPQVGYAIEFELGAVRCNPSGDEHAGPSCEEWTAAFFQVDADAASMRRAVCCLAPLLPPGDLYLEGQWEPIDGQGGCIGGRMTVTVQSTCGECA